MQEKKEEDPQQVLNKVFFLGCSPTINEDMLEHVREVIEKYA